MFYNLPEAERPLGEKPMQREKRARKRSGRKEGDGASLIAQLVKNPPATQETLV